MKILETKTASKSTISNRGKRGSDMKRFSQTLRIGLALFLAIFGTSALPTAAASALEADTAASETQTVQAEQQPVAETAPIVVEATPPPPEPEPLPAPLPPEELIIEEEPVQPVLVDEEEVVLQQRTFVAESQQSIVPDEVVTTNGHQPVTICHRTASYTNPYVKITVDSNAVDGIAGNSGNEADHYGEHKGPLFNSNLPKHTEWGDIIPVLPGVHLGQNLANGGQAILDANCATPIGLVVEASACVIGKATNGSVSIWVYGTAGGTKVVVSDGTTFNVNDNTVMPLVVTGLGAGEYTVAVTKANETLLSEKVTIYTCPPIEIPLPEPTSTDPCGPRNASWILPADTEQYTWEITEGNELVVTTVPPYVFAEEETSHNFGTPEDKNVPCPIEVTPVEPALLDICYSDKDGIYIGYTKGVTYKVNGEKTKGWVSYEGTDLNVTAEVKEGYVFAEGAVTTWNFTASSFTDEQCLTITKTAKVASDTNLDGLIGLGDTVTWTITVTNTSDQKYEAFYVEVEDPNTVLEDDGYVGVLDPGQSKDLTATSTITAKDLEVCKVTNTATFYGWRAYAQDRELSYLTLDHEEEITEALAMGSSAATYNLVCPEPGQVLGDTTVKPAPVVASTPQVLPATLPATGGASDSNFGMVLGIVLSALTYFAMLRRYQEA